MKKGDSIEVEISKFAFEGKGIAKTKIEDAEDPDVNFVVFVDKTYPGDKALVQIIKKKKNFAEAKLLEIIEPSPLRTTPKCKFFGTCGGCKIQDLKYESQLEYKQRQAIDLFERIGGIEEFSVCDIIKSDINYFYRNKMEFSFSDKRWLFKEEINSDESFADRFALGLHVPGMFDKIIDINECYLQSEISQRIVNHTRAFFRARNIQPYSTKTHEGFLRNLVIKNSLNYHDLMVNLVTASENDSLMREYSEDLKYNFPEITTIIQNINLKKAQIAVGDYEKVLFGEGYIVDSIEGLKFRISANSFFQTNPLQAKKLYASALEFADLKGKETVYDLFCGAGTISMCAAKRARTVYGFESAPSAISDAKTNLKLNNINNTFFFHADLNKGFLNVIKNNSIPLPDIIITDPPRSGMNPTAIDDIAALAPNKIVYISCNPATQARDVKLFFEKGYNLNKIQPIDMFPNTFHIENIALLSKINQTL